TVLRTFAGFPGEEPAIWPAVWETPTKLLAPVHRSNSFEQTVLRLSVGNRMERATVLARGPRSSAPVTLMPPRG
ncbi:MAG: hypothetical protein Q7T71_08205, partial [Herbiconiux sp.]|nr:hypothetical protein [Herbiconiux sp.]